MARTPPARSRTSAVLLIVAAAALVVACASGQDDTRGQPFTGAPTSASQASSTTGGPT